MNSGCLSVAYLRNICISLVTEVTQENTNVIYAPIYSPSGNKITKQHSSHRDQAKPQERLLLSTIHFCKYWAKGLSRAGVCEYWFSWEQSLHYFAKSVSFPRVRTLARDKDRRILPRFNLCPDLSITVTGNLYSPHECIWYICLF